MKRARKNPEKFDRCVRDVKRRAKKSRRSVNAYAVCTAAGIRNNRKLKRKNVAGLVGGAELLAQEGPVLLTRVGKELRILPAGRKKNKGKVKASRRQNRGKVRVNGRPSGARAVPEQRNPLEQSQQTFQQFHGRPSEQTIKITTPIHDHKYLAAIGELEKLVIIDASGYEVVLTDFKGAILCQNEREDSKGKKRKPQLFIEGGDQRVQLEDFGIREPIHEKEVLGELQQVWYFTVKDHLGDEGGEAVYRHRLKKTRFRQLPTVVYDTVNQLLEIVGGNYSINDEGIED